MCGRYVATQSAEQIIEEFDVEANQAGELVRDYNVAPSKQVAAVVQRPARDDRPAQRQLRSLAWGLIPSWAKDPTIGNRMINARVETVAEKPAFRRAFALRRAILPADGYYEWYQTQQKTATGRPRKQPFYIHPKSGGSMAMAGIYEIWKDPEKGEQDPDQFRWTCTILTTAAEESLAAIHDRMPVLLTPGQYDAWLDPANNDPQELLRLIAATPTGLLESFPVSTEVSNARNNGPALIEPIRLD
ncbi:MAG TPA: SOS response-associated peptidase [Marmoricola sp.]|nr:SOS response-associated peptidase [Marmoricola sp.]